MRQTLAEDKMVVEDMVAAVPVEEDVTTIPTNKTKEKEPIHSS